MRDFRWKDLPWAAGTRVLANGPDWAAVDKPAGVLSHPNPGKETGKALVRAPWDAEAEGYRLPDGLEIGLCHRLDGPTSGVLLFASGPALSWFREAFEAGRMRKKYWAVAVGRPRRTPFVWKDRLARRRAEGRLRVEVAADGAAAETRGRELDFRRGALPLCLLLLEPGTGRTHQLRVQAAKNGLPILGDRNYGDFRANRAFQRGGGDRRLFLHAAELSWKREGSKETVRSPVPEEFKKLFPGIDG